MKTYEVFDIQYDTDGEDVPGLPATLTLTAASEEDLADAISDKTGFCHTGFKFSELGPAPVAVG